MSNGIRHKFHQFNRMDTNACKQVYQLVKIRPPFIRVNSYPFVLIRA